jgi:cysteine-rich repeat protein
MELPPEPMMYVSLLPLLRSVPRTLFASGLCAILVACANVVPLSPQGGSDASPPPGRDTTRPIPPIIPDAGGSDFDADATDDPATDASEAETGTGIDAGPIGPVVPGTPDAGPADVIEPPDSTTGADTGVDAVPPPDTSIPDVDPTPDASTPDATDPDTGVNPGDDAGGEPVCAPSVCSAEGSLCAGDVARVCARDADGCLFATDTPCGATGCDPASGTCITGGGGDAVCGNGIVEAGEECDDGNREVDDGCTPDCMIERPYTCTNNAGYVACDATWSFDTTGTNYWTGYPCSGIPYGGQEMILYLRPPRSGPVTLTMRISSASSTSDWDLMVLDGDSAPQCGPGIQCVAQGISTSNNETVTFNAVAGKLYLLVIDGDLSLISSRQSARGTMQIACP